MVDFQQVVKRAPGVIFTNHKLRHMVAVLIENFDDEELGIHVKKPPGA